MKTIRPQGYAGYFRGAARVEKPLLDGSRKHPDAGGFHWNSNIFCFKAGVIRDESSQYVQEVTLLTEACRMVVRAGCFVSACMFNILAGIFAEVRGILRDFHSAFIDREARAIAGVDVMTIDLPDAFLTTCPGNMPGVNKATAELAVWV